MIRFLTEHPENIYVPLLEHIWLVLVTLIISVAVAAVLTVLAIRYQKLENALMNLFSVLYSVPSLAFLRF